NGRAHAAIQLQGETQQNLADLMCRHEGRNMGNVPIHCTPVERLERLRRPTQLIAQGDPDPLRSIVECENSLTLHECTAATCARLVQKPFLTPHPTWPGPFLLLAPFQVCHHRSPRPPPPS